MGYDRRRGSRALGYLMLVTAVSIWACWLLGVLPRGTTVSACWTDGARRLGVRTAGLADDAPGRPMEGAKADVECLRQMLGVNWACTATYYEAGLDESGSTLTSRSSIRFTEVLNDNHRWELTGVQSDVRGVLGQLRAHLLRREDAGGRQILVIERVDFSRGYVAAVIGFVDGPSLEVSGRFIDSSGRIGKFSMKRTT